MDRQPTTLRCPSCGAPAAPDAARCEYCQARLATVGCPVCFGLLFEGAAFCPYCGASRSRSEQPEQQTIKCPACRDDMHWVRVGDVDLLECGHCDGTWIESAAFERLCADREGQSSILQKNPTDSKSPSSLERVRYRPCPRCRKLMNRMNFGRVSGAIVDVCRGHGTFLDRGELHQVVRFILEGGLSKMRQIERDQLQEEERRVRDLDGDQARVTYSVSHRVWPASDEKSIQQFLTMLLGRSIF
jgi:Zn-finger nucleic acid-binding protein